MRALALALALILPPMTASADPNPQLLRSVEMRLARYQLYPDIQSLTTAQAGALHMTMVQNNEDGYARTRAKLEAILRWDDTEDEK